MFTMKKLLVSIINFLNPWQHKLTLKQAVVEACVYLLSISINLEACSETVLISEGL